MSQYKMSSIVSGVGMLGSWLLKFFGVGCGTSKRQSLAE